MTRPVRTRFAPSPTRALHLGNIRTAALNWLFARHCEGAFVLRLEDTDTARNVEGGEADILDALDWLGLDRDEGPDVGGPHGPYRQSERAGRHRVRAEALLESGHAFRCFCSPGQLEEDRAAAIASGDPPGMDRRCRDLDPATARERAEGLPDGESPAIRLRVDPGPVPYEDRLKGRLAMDGADLGDLVLLRPDGRATYNFAVAVDDLDMEISHVIRGVGHLSNTPKQVLLYGAFGEEPPEFVHIPTVLAPGGGKLSKRAGARGVLEYRDDGYLPDAILNYVSLLGWSARSGEEVLSRAGLIEAIDLDRIGAADPEIDPDKLRWLNGQHLRRLPPGLLAERWGEIPEVGALKLDLADLTRAAAVFAERTYVYPDAAEELVPVFATPRLSDPEAAEILSGADATHAIEALTDAWRESDWSPEELNAAMRAAMKATGLPGGAFFRPTRVALMGSPQGPSLADVAYALGRERTMARLERASERARAEEPGTPNVEDG